MCATCPTCGRPYPKSKTAHTNDTPVDVATLSETQRRAYYAKTAPVEDARFALRINLPLSPELRAEWEAHVQLAPSLTRTEAMRRLARLQEQWRKSLIPPARQSEYMQGSTPIVPGHGWPDLHTATRSPHGR